MGQVARRREGSTAWLLLFGLMGCEADSFELASADEATDGQVERTPEANDALPKGEVSTPSGDDASDGRVDAPPVANDVVSTGEVSTPESVDRPRPPSGVPTARLATPPIVLPPQAVYDLPSAYTLTDRPHWRWVAIQPSLSKSNFIPSGSDSSPSMELNVAGDYVFELHAWEEAEAQSEIVWTQAISVISGLGIHVELLWDTPADLNQSDEGSGAGTDLDLHFAHAQNAVNGGYDGDGDGVDDPWFNQPFDTFWFTPGPNWGTLDPTANDDPALDRDDTDGAGPENLNLSSPQNGASYLIGVHYWFDNGYGHSTATVRVYVDGTLIYERSQVMKNLDMWYVGQIDWPSGDVTTKVGADGEQHVTPHYQNPNFSE